MSIQTKQETIKATFFIRNPSCNQLKFCAIHMRCSELLHISPQNQDDIPLGNLMDWFFVSDNEDHAVPEDVEMFDRLPSPDTLFSRGNVIGNFNSSEKLNVLGLEELIASGTMFSGAVEQLARPSICQGSRHTFHQRSACPREYSDFELDDLPIIDEADDIFFDSLFKVDARALEEVDLSAHYTQTSSNYDPVEAFDRLGGRNPTQDTEDDAGTVCHLIPEKDMEEQPNLYGDTSEDYISMEVSVLFELKSLAAQLAKETRNCFRDSLYRLAENSRNQTKCCWNGKEDMENCKVTSSIGPSRLQESKAKNSDANAIDRTVATLLFDTMKFCQPSVASTSGPSETLQTEYQTKDRLYHPSSSVSLHFL